MVSGTLLSGFASHQAERFHAKFAENKSSLPGEINLANRSGFWRIGASAGNTARRFPKKKMSKEQNTPSQAQEAAQTPAPIASVSKETMERHQQEQATAIGCDSKKTVSGFEYLLILIRALVIEGVISKADLPRAASMAKGMKANNSALRQWLYERPEEKTTVSKIAEKYLEM